MNKTALVSGSFVASFLYLLYRYWINVRKYDLIELKGPKIRFFLGSFKFADPVLQSFDLLKEIGNEKFFKKRIFIFPSISIIDLNLIKDVLSIKNLPKSAAYKEIEKWWGKNNLLTSQSDTESWRAHRLLLNPAFKTTSVRLLRGYFEKHANHLVQRIGSYQGKAFDCKETMQKVTIDIISEAGFGYDLGALQDRDGEFIKAMNEQMTLLSNPLVIFPGGGSLLKWLYRKSKKVIDDLFNQVIKNKLDSNPTSQNSQRDLLDMMLEAKEYREDKEMLRSDLFTFFLAGHETSATTLSWAIYELSKNQDIQDEAYQEIVSSLQDKTQVDEKEDLTTVMPYLTSCLNETLRMYPPVPSVARTVTKETEIGGVKIPQGTSISCCIYFYNRDPDVWKEPDRFNPSRFFDQSLDSIPEILSFSAGPRICIGKHFFYEESLVILYRILQNFRIVLADQESGRINGMTGLIKPNKVVVQFIPR